jgi:hypothetical protein
MFIIRRQDAKAAVWLTSIRPEQWGERARAIRFDTRWEARRAATSLKISGDWSITVAAQPPVLLSEPPSPASRFPGVK